MAVSSAERARHRGPIFGVSVHEFACGLPLNHQRKCDDEAVVTKSTVTGRIPALDGLRTVAIAMVVAYHVDNQVVPAGHWGVPLFFVLSGFVITSAICAEMDATGGLNVLGFYRKRFVRLVPAVFVVCLAMLAIGTAWSQVQPAIGFYANYARTEGVTLGRLTHTWFIAVIFHFYMLWPLVMKAIPANRRVHIIGGLAVIAIVWRAIAIEVMSPGWVYNASDTNAAALMVGCFLAVAKLPKLPLAQWSIPALLGLMLLPVFGNTGSMILWGGFLALGLSAVALEYAKTAPVWLENRILLAVAEVSFGVFLWHYVFVRSDIPLWSAAIFTVIATLASWHLVERPITTFDANRRARSNAAGDELRSSTTDALLKKLVFSVGALNLIVLIALAVVRVGGGDLTASSLEGDAAVLDQPAPTSSVLETRDEDSDDDVSGSDQPVEEPPLPAYPEPFEPTANEVQPEAKHLGALVTQIITTYEVDSSLDDVLATVPPVESDFFDAMVVEVQAVHHPGMWSRGTVEYVQMGGHRDGRISMIVVIRQDLGREGSTAPERVETRTMEVRLAGSATDGWELETIASTGGSPVERPADLHPLAAAVVDHPRIDLPDTGAWDIYNGYINLQLLQVMLDIADRTPYAVVVLQTGHSYNVFGTNRVSNHSIGRAVDIYKLESELVIDSHEPSSSYFYVLSEWVVWRYDIKEFGSPWLFPDAVARTFTDEVHHDHLHIGVLPYPSSPEPPPTTTTSEPPPTTTTTLVEGSGD